ncbi:hypothetical protein BG04_1443 [Priestia megaterium NBRC 15308 = ATCC 14581]|uniref:DUF4054 domain-containing protein n=1 Tax=Priestia megaterium (strain ATCC 14581 / DSM 32 / CCUG 1817 / JCM 2506 / NBRC 15308 / NCIMB 9376 / NCTC 10342 / NRRL B-14308 / VKM B-512 / Ford 19) TaxID=1348623 RepID=A0A0B6AI16_PRIM2|nr:hypothetical protein BG04_1443 [Priestia megaterium NBRC 15308 = ATCC 14581]KGJ84230.1 hypothetical protein BMT_13220 [Priestia megaterium NBRC 15308 = ATCC 14581]SUV22823.1 Uncharacterised protein [Priestia megaterium]
MIDLKTTPEIIQKTAEHLASMSPDVLEIFIDDATLEVENLDVSEDNKQRLIRYYATHLATIKAQTVKRKKLDVMETEYNVSNTAVGLESTPYGQEYSRLLKKLTKRNSINLTVI